MLKQPFIYIELCKIFQKYLVLIILVLLLSEFMFMDKIVNCMLLLHSIVQKSTHLITIRNPNLKVAYKVGEYAFFF